MRELLHLRIDRLNTPIGELLIVTDREDNLRAVDWTEYESRMHRLLHLHYGEGGYTFEPARTPNALTFELGKYFAGELTAIDTLPVQTGGTSFQRDVWSALRTIRPGTTICYAQLADQIRRPKAVRAVGLANGSNPVGVVVPCHRVIGADGSLTGYGGGIERKSWLLRHEVKYGRDCYGRKKHAHDVDTSAVEAVCGRHVTDIAPLINLQSFYPAAPTTGSNYKTIRRNRSSLSFQRIRG
jgi:methylated-DNA-[protein]-cysteine S-methyltransferase